MNDNEVSDDTMIFMTVGQFKDMIIEAAARGTKEIVSNLAKRGIVKPGEIDAYVTRDGGETYIRNPALKD